MADGDLSMTVTVSGVSDGAPVLVTDPKTGKPQRQDSGRGARAEPGRDTQEKIGSTDRGRTGQVS